MPRSWLNNVIFTLDPEFSDWVAEVQKERAAKILAEQKLGINLDPEIAEIFQQSHAISSKYAAWVRSELTAVTTHVSSLISQLLLVLVLTCLFPLSLACHGSSAALMKITAKKRRSKAQIKEERKLEQNHQAAMAQKLEAI